MQFHEILVNFHGKYSKIYFFAIDFFDFTSYFAWTFFNFLAHCRRQKGIILGVDTRKKFFNSSFTPVISLHTYIQQERDFLQERSRTKKIARRRKNAVCVVWFDFPHLSRDLVYCLLQKMWTRVVFLDVVQLSDIYFRFDFFKVRNLKGLSSQQIT